jgi:hypothetical protein
VSVCRSCGAPILWAVTEHERRMPLDRDPYTGPEPGGLFALRLDGENAPLAIAATPEAFADEPLYRSHFATCPDAKEWRRNP